MKLIKPKFEILESQGLFKDIEIAARTCYKSELNITEGSADKMVKSLIERTHFAMLEHGTIYLTIHENELAISKYQYNKYSIVKNSDDEDDENYYITTNYRVLVENGWLDDLKYQCEPTEFHEKRVSVRFICDRGVSHEFVRHRVFSFAQESTRYCNYSKDKFGNELTFIIPSWLDLKEGSYEIDWDTVDDVTYWGWFNGVGNEHIKSDWENSRPGEKDLYLSNLSQSEDSYLRLLKKGWTAQQARSVLSNSLKTELIMTGFVSDWEHFFHLRASGTAHPQAQELAIPLQEEFGIRKLI